MKQIAIATVLLASCTKRNPEACCETPDECLRLGTAETVSCETGACVNFKCVEDGTCDGPEDCSGPDTCQQNVCTPLGPDASMTPAFDVAYPNVWRRSTSAQLPFDLIVIPTGDHAIAMGSLSLKSITDDHPTATVRLILNTHGDQVPVAHAGGFAVPVAEQLIFTSGLVPEARVTTNEPGYLDWEVIDAPDGTYDITTHIVMELDGVEFPLDFVTHVVPGPTIFADPEEATRSQLTH